MSDKPHQLNYFTPSREGLVRVYGARDSMEAEFVRGLLEEAGMFAVVQGEAVGAVLGPMLGAAVAAGVYVREEDAAAAGEVIEQYERGEHPRGEPWVCSSCGERVEGQFTHCWRCGWARGDDQADGGLEG